MRLRQDGRGIDGMEVRENTMIANILRQHPITSDFRSSGNG